MKNRLMAVTAFAGALAVAGSPVAQTRSCHLQALGELKIVEEGSHVTVAGAIDGKPVRFILDTGAFGTMLLGDAVRKIGLPLHRMANVKLYGVGGGTDAYSAWVKELRVGDLTLDGATLMVSEGRIDGIAGLIGAKFLFQSDIEFDLAHKAVRFFKATDCVGDQVVYWGGAYAVAPMAATLDESPRVTIRLNGAPIVAEMDTGAPRSVVTSGAARRLAAPGDIHTVKEEDRVHGLAAVDVPVSVATFQSFEFGDEKIGNSRLEIANLFSKDTEVPMDSRIGASVIDSPQMLLGADFFHAHRIFFAREQRKIYVSYQGGPVFAPTPVDKP